MQSHMSNTYYPNNTNNSNDSSMTHDNLYNTQTTSHPIYSPQLSKPLAPQSYNEIIILSEDEKNDLMKKYDKMQPKPTAENIKTDDFLSYLTNPMVLQMFNMMVNQMNQQTTNQKIIPKEKISDIVVDEILDINQVQALII